MIPIFFYGTLRAGESNAGLVAGLAHIGQATTVAGYKLYDTGPFPAATVGGATALIGDLYDIDGPTLAILDRLEAHPHVYNRRRIETSAGIAWMYVWIRSCNPEWPIIVDGDWCRYRQARDDARRGNIDPRPATR